MVYCIILCHETDKNKQVKTPPKNKSGESYNYLITYSQTSIKQSPPIDLPFTKVLEIISLNYFQAHLY